jgi:hypothetical protein
MSGDIAPQIGRPAAARLVNRIITAHDATQTRPCSPRKRENNLAVARGAPFRPARLDRYGVKIRRVSAGGQPP